MEELFEEERGKDAKTEEEKARAAEWRQFDRRSLDVLRQLGARLVPVKLPSKTPVGPLSLILTAEAATAFDALVRDGRVKTMVRQTADAWPNVFRHGRLIPAVEYLRAQRVRTLLMREMEECLVGRRPLRGADVRRELAPPDEPDGTPVRRRAERLPACRTGRRRASRSPGSSGERATSSPSRTSSSGRRTSTPAARSSRIPERAPAGEVGGPPRARGRLGVRIGEDVSSGGTLPAASSPPRCSSSREARPRLDPSTPLSQYGLDAWQDGLPQNSIHSVLQTREGYLWFGTYEGLVRFNGVSFVVYDMRNTTALKSNSVWTLLEDRLGTLWVGTLGGGVVRTRGGVFTRYGEREGLPSEYAWALAEDSGGDALGRDRPRPRPVRRDRRSAPSPSPAPFERPSIRSLLGDPAGGLWIGTATDGLLRWDGKVGPAGPPEGGSRARSRHAPRPVSRAGSPRRSTASASSRPGGRRREGPGKKDGLPSELLWSLHRDRNGALWVGSDGARARADLEGPDRDARRRARASCTPSSGRSARTARGASGSGRTAA